MRYRRDRVAGATWFFTVNLADRRSDLLVRHIASLRAAFRTVRASHPFELDAIVILPEHLHAVMRLPDGDAAYALRWGLIKASFTRAVAGREFVAGRRAERRERSLWQARYWEHRIRDARDHAAHVDYVHYNPVKHGHVQRPIEWPFSSVHRYVARGLLPPDWASDPDTASGSATWGERADVR